MSSQPASRLRQTYPPQAPAVDPAPRPSATVVQLAPSPRLRPANPEKVGLDLGPELNALNQWARGRGFGYQVRRALGDQLLSAVLNDLRRGLGLDEMRLWLAIYGRTLAFGKLAEKISRAHFLEGMRDENGQLAASGGAALMAPVVHNQQKLKAGLAGLTEKGLLTAFRFQWGRKEQTAYSPFSCLWLTSATHWVAEFSEPALRLTPEQRDRELAVHVGPAFDLSAREALAIMPYYDAERFFFPDGSPPLDPPPAAGQSTRPRDHRHRLPSTRSGPVH